MDELPEETQVVDHGSARGKLYWKRCALNLNNGSSPNFVAWNRLSFVVAQALLQVELRPETGAGPQLAFDPNLAPMSLDDGLGNRQPQAAASDLLVAHLGRLHPVETLENARDVFLWDAGAGILHLQAHAGMVRRDHQAQVHCPPIRGVLDGIIDQIINQAPQVILIALNDRSHVRQA